jgi:hypothetical protein
VTSLRYRTPNGGFRALAGPVNVAHDPSMTRLHHSACSVLAGAVVMLAAVGVGIPAPADAQLTNVSHADEVCPPAADPCVVEQSVEIQDGALLDFDTRTVELQAGGVFSSGSGSATIRCGGLSASLGDALALSAWGGGPTIDGGSLTVESLRRCSSGLRASVFDRIRLCARHM